MSDSPFKLGDVCEIAWPLGPHAALLGGRQCTVLGPLFLHPVRRGADDAYTLREVHEIEVPGVPAEQFGYEGWCAEPCELRLIRPPAGGHAAGSWDGCPWKPAVEVEK